MNDLKPNDRNWFRAIGIGIAVSILTAIIMVTLFQSGITPFPQLPSLAFAETATGLSLTIPVGLLFHTAYVTFWSVIFVRYFPRRNLATAFALAGALWLVALVIFFPINGWGFAGLQISPRMIPASFVPHLLFGFFLWVLHKYLPRRKNPAGYSGSMNTSAQH